MENNKITMMITTLVCFLPLILSMILYNDLPDNIPIHFNLNGEIDNYAPKDLAAFGLPILLATINIFIHFRLKNNKERKNISKTMEWIAKWIMPAISLIAVPINLFLSLGYNIPVHIIIPSLIGLLFTIIGNYLPKNRQNDTFGFKLPWTLADQNNWNKINRLAGFMMIITGVLIVVLSLFQMLTAYLLMVVLIIMLILIPVIYSYILSKCANFRRN